LLYFCIYTYSPKSSPNNSALSLDSYLDTETWQNRFYCRAYSKTILAYRQKSCQSIL